MVDPVKRFNKAFFGFWFRLFGWKIGKYPPKLNRYVIAVAPHTSNWDFGVGYCVKHIADLHPNFLGKDSLFKIPLVGWFLRNMGGVPVDRSRNVKLVDQMVEKFEELDHFIVAITPEGTRSYSPKWKTGFYYVAQKANVPIVMAGLDYGTRTVIFSDPFHASGDVDKDLEFMKDFFRPMKGKHPEKGVK